jgi:hypothetical protein
MRRIVLAVAAVVVALGVAVVGQMPTAAARASGDTIASIMSLLHQPTDQFPAVALTVDGHPVSGSFVNYEVTMIQYLAQQRHQTVSRHDAIQIAIDKAVRHELFLSEAQRRGLTVSDAEVSAFVQQQVQNAARQGDPQALMADVLQANGDATVGQYETDPKVLENARDLLLMQKLTQVLQAEQPGVNIVNYYNHLRGSATVQVNFSY